MHASARAPHLPAALLGLLRRQQLLQRRRDGHQLLLAAAFLPRLHTFHKVGLTWCYLLHVTRCLESQTYLRGLLLLLLEQLGEVLIHRAVGL